MDDSTATQLAYEDRRIAVMFSGPDREDDCERARLRRLAMSYEHAVEQECRDAVARLEMPYVVVISSEFTTQITGPYVDAFAALCAAEMELSFNENLPEDERIRVALAPLKPDAA